MAKISEAFVEEQLLTNLRCRRNLEFAAQQVYVSGKRIDIVYKDLSDDKLIGVEVKLKDWRGALRQAYLNKFAIEDSYVALWHEHAKSALEHLDDFTDAGVGLAIVDEEYRLNVFIPAGRNTVLSKNYQNELSFNLSNALCAV